MSQSQKLAAEYTALYMSDPIKAEENLAKRLDRIKMKAAAVGGGVVGIVCCAGAVVYLAVQEEETN